MEYKERVEPCKYIGYLMFGLIMLAMNLVMITHIFNYVALEQNGKRQITPFLNQMLEKCQSSQARFLAIVVFSLIGYYYLYCSHKGHTKSGLRFYFWQFYPIFPKQTFTS